MRGLISLALLHAVCVYVVHVGAQSCGAGSLDLSSEFIGEKETLSFDGPQNFEFSVTPCGNSAEPCRPGNGGSTVHTFINGSCSWVLARYGEGEWSVLGDTDNVADGVSVRYRNGDVAFGCTTSAPIVTVNFVCEGELGAEGENDCDYTITVPSQAVCAAAAAPPVPAKGGLSGGWVFVIILLVFFSVYMIGGVAYNTVRKGEKGTEAIPNISFWRSLPSLVGDGCAFAWSKLTGAGRSAAEDSYRGGLIPDDK